MTFFRSHLDLEFYTLLLHSNRLLSHRPKPNRQIPSNICMCIGTTILSWFWYDTDCIRCFDPLLRCQRKSIITRFCFKPIEFDRFKIGIVNLFPQAQKWNCRMITHPVCHHDKSIVWIFLFCNISEWNVSILINNIAHHSDFCSIGIYFHILHISLHPSHIVFQIYPTLVLQIYHTPSHK